LYQESPREVDLPSGSINVVRTYWTRYIHCCSTAIVAVVENLLIALVDERHDTVPGAPIIQSTNCRGGGKERPVYALSGYTPRLVLGVQLFSLALWKPDDNVCLASSVG
jgi:hypothetical protein